MRPQPAHDAAGGARWEQFPADAGSYVLLLHLDRPQGIPVGRLGCCTFAAGWQLYVGSARGPGGLRARLRHHLTPVTRPHWHVDFLRAAAPCVAVWYAAGAARCECAWAAVLASLPGAALPLPRFGASDCRCPAHLYAFAACPDPDEFAARTGALLSVAAQPVAAHPSPM